MKLEELSVSPPKTEVRDTRAASAVAEFMPCVMFLVSSTLLRYPVCRLGVGLIHQREKTHQTFSVSGVTVFRSSVDAQGSYTACMNV